MSRYVDIDKPLFVRVIIDEDKVVTQKHTLAEILENTVGILPIETDVIEVTRCEKCGYCDKDKRWDGYWCYYYNEIVDKDFYCRHGEREENERSN